MWQTSAGGKRIEKRERLTGIIFPCLFPQKLLPLMWTDFASHVTSWAKKIMRKGKKKRGSGRMPQMLRTAYMH